MYYIESVMAAVKDLEWCPHSSPLTPHPSRPDAQGPLVRGIPTSSPLTIFFPGPTLLPAPASGHG